MELRDVIIDQIGKQGGTLPKKFIFLKSVGRAMTQVKHMQEKQLKVKNFLPPFVSTLILTTNFRWLNEELTEYLAMRLFQAYCPEIFIMSRDPIGESGEQSFNNNFQLFNWKFSITTFF